MIVSGSGDQHVSQRIWRASRWFLLAIIFGYVAIVLYTYILERQSRLDQAAATMIEKEKITNDDVDGIELPAEPDAAVASASLAGADANGNGIRDDVELAIFSSYPTSSSSTAQRAAELQYAMDLQSDITQVVGTTSWAAAAANESRGIGCLFESFNGNLADAQKQITDLVLNTPSREQRYLAIDQYGAAYKLSSGPDCDVARN